MKKYLLIIILFVSINEINAQATYTLDSTVLTSRIVKDSIDIPWEIIWGHDDFIWMTERYGRVSRINPSTGQQHVILDISSTVYDNSESGLLGMALHPDFANSPYVYLAYTYLQSSNIKERIVRYTYNGTSLVSPFTLIDNILGNTTHIGCRLIILLDTTMLISTGDAQNQSLPQDTSSIIGKILRINLDGTIPADNPFPNSLIYSFGHRNAQGLWLAPNGKIYSSEHGPTSDDELNIISSSRNYGWPTVTGFCDSPPEISFCNANNVVEPLAAWTPTIAPSDIIWYSHSAIPEFKDKLLMTVLKDKSLIAFKFNTAGDSVISQKKYFQNNFNRLRDICVSPAGKIYLATNGSAWNNTNPFTHSIIELSNNSFTTSINANKVNDVKIGPNPIGIGQSLMVNINNSEKGIFTLYDILGRPVLSQNVFNSTAIPVSVKSGIYIWKIEFESKNVSEGKLIVQ